MPVSVAILYHSQFGHTAKVAQAVAEGVAALPGAHATLLNVGTLEESGWRVLDAADAIIFGSPTYMGGVSAAFKDFIDATSKRWFAQAWKDKVAAGFTVSGSYSGDKLNTLFQLAVYAMQHSMIWVGTGIMPGSTKGESDVPEADQVNRFGSYMGLMAQASSASPEVTPPAGDIETARLFGQRIAEVTARFAQRK